MQSTDETRRELARQYLKRAREDLERATRVRIQYVRDARSHGLTNADIGEQLNITEAGVRALIARHPSAAE